MTKNEVKEICSKRGFETNYSGRDKKFYIYPLRLEMLTTRRKNLLKKWHQSRSEIAQTDEWIERTPKLTKRFKTLINHVCKTSTI